MERACHRLIRRIIVLQIKGNFLNQFSQLLSDYRVKVRKGQCVLVLQNFTSSDQGNYRINFCSGATQIVTVIGADPDLTTWDLGGWPLVQSCKNISSL